MICNRELEKRLIAGLIQYPDTWEEISVWIEANDFPSEGSSINNTIFCILRNALNSQEKIDEIIIAERIKNLNIAFEDNIDVTQYILGLKKLVSIEHDQVIEVARELKKVSICRRIEKAGIELQQNAKKSTSSSLDDIILSSDRIYNSYVNIQTISKKEPINICEEMQEDVEFLGENQVEENGLKCPYKRTNDLYGPLLKPGDITCVGSRTGIGKTKISMESCVKTTQLYNYEIPIIHFDNGEMSKMDIEMRLCSQLSRIPLWYIRTGKWRNNEEFSKKIREVWKYVKNIKFNYYQVSGLSPEQMVNELKKFYFSKIGRYNKETGIPNQLIFSFDYIKQTTGMSEYRKMYELVGEMIQRFKTAIQSDIVDDKGLPVISMFTSVQSNRTGIVGNKKSDELSDDDGQISLSDQIGQQVSQLFLLRKKTIDELVSEPNFGTHKFINLKPRNMGKEAERANTLVKIRTSKGEELLVKNCIHLNIDGFNVDEIGDTVDLVNSLDVKRNLDPNSNQNSDDEGTNL